MTPSGLVCLAADKPEGGHTLERIDQRLAGTSTTDHLVRRPTHELVRGHGAWVAEATGLIELRGWPAGTRLILRKERPHPGAQLRITDADGLRITGFLTNTAHGGPARQLADLELRHRRHARVEDRIRAAKDTGLRNLPFHDTDQNRIWLAITALAQDLLAWCTRLALPATVAATSPNDCGCASRHRRTARAHRTPARPAHRLDLALGRDDHHRTHPTPRAPRPLTQPPIPTTGDLEHRQTTLSRQSPRSPIDTRPRTSSSRVSRSQDGRYERSRLVGSQFMRSSWVPGRGGD